MIDIETELLKRVNTWLTPTFDNNTQTYIKDLIATNPSELKEAFYKDLEFGTGGMRGVMGIGTNRINKYTLGKNTQGLSNYMHQEFPDETLAKDQLSIARRLGADIIAQENAPDQPARRQDHAAQHGQLCIPHRQFLFGVECFPVSLGSVLYSR